MTVSYDDNVQGIEKLRLIRYDEDALSRNHDFRKQPWTTWQTLDPQTQAPLVSLQNSSWGSIHAKVRIFSDFLCPFQCLTSNETLDLSSQPSSLFLE